MAETIMSMMPSVHLPSSDDVPVPDEPHVSVDDDATIASATLPIAKIVATPIAPSDSTSARHTPQQGNQENQENLEPSVHTRNASSGTTLSDESNNIMGVLPGPSVMTVEEYLASTARPDDDNANPNTETFKSSKKKKNKSRSDVPAVDDNGEPIPIPVGAPRTSHAIIALHELCQGYELTLPTFTYTDDFDCMWKGEMGFLGRTFKEERLCASKQEVKEKLCAVGIKEVEGLVEKGELVKSGKMRKKKAAGGADGQAQAEGEEPEKDGVNWKGMLLEFQTSLSAPQPLYADFLLGTRFYTVLTLHHGGAPSIPLIFGSKETTFPSKKAAQQHASKLAVQHLQSTGLWPETDSAGIRKKKKNNTPAQEHTDGGKENLPPSYAARATSLATQLHLGAPQYRWASKPKAPDFHDVAAFFPSAGGAGSSELEGPVGQVRNVHGKKRAKEECAKLVVRVLEGVRERRERELRDVFGEGGAGGRKGEVRMMVDLKGMKGVEKGDDGVGKEREREMRGVGVGQDDGEDEYDDETFEDAVEEVVKAGV